MIAEKIKTLLPPELQLITTIGEFPTDSDSCIAITESGGPHGNYFSKQHMDTPIVQLSVRDTDYKRGAAYINICKNVLASHTDAQSLGIVLAGDIMYFGRDIKRRNTWQLTFRIFSSID